MADTEPDAESPSASNPVDEYHERAAELLTEGRVHEACEMYERALVSASTNLQRAEILTEYGWAQYEALPNKGRAAEFAHEALKTLRAEPDLPEIIFFTSLAHALLAHCVWQESSEALNREAKLALAGFRRLTEATRATEWTAQACLESAKLCNMCHEPQQAEDWARRYLALCSGSKERLRGLPVLAEAYRLAGNLAEAHKAISEAIIESSTDVTMKPTLYFSKGLIERGQGRSADAQRSFERSAELLESHPLRTDLEFRRELYRNLGETYYEAQRYAESAAAFQTLFPTLDARDPYQDHAMLCLGHCYLAIGASAAARDSYEDVLGSTTSTSEQRLAAREGLSRLDRH